MDKSIDFSLAMSKVHFFFILKQKRNSETSEKIGEMSSSTEQALRKSKSNHILEAYFRTLYVLAKQHPAKIIN